MLFHFLRRVKRQPDVEGRARKAPCTSKYDQLITLKKLPHSSYYFKSSIAPCSFFNVICIDFEDS